MSIQEPKQKKKVALYIRVSTDEQAEMFGVDLQRSALMGLIQSKGGEYEFAGEDYVYIDEGVSGSDEPEERPEFKRLKEDILLSPEPPFDIVAVYKIDRFARRLKILLEILDFFENRETPIEFLSSQESIDTSTPFGRAMLGIIGVIAELELETIKERTAQGKERAAEQGVYMGSSPPVGYIKGPDKKILIHDEEADIVKKIFNLYVNDRYSLEYISKYLRDHKIYSPSEMKYRHDKEQSKKKRRVSKHGPYHWYPQAVKRILEDELYIGKQYYNKSKDGEKLPKEEWDYCWHDQRIIDDETFRKTQTLLNRTGRRAEESKQHRIYLLQGLLKCANCFDPEKHEEPYTWHGIPQKVRSTGEMAYYYECSCKNTSKKRVRNTVCHTISLPAIPLEEHVINFLHDLIKDPKPIFDYQQKLQSSANKIKYKKKNLKEILKLINSYKASRRRVIELYTNGDIKKKEKDERLEKLENDQKRYLKEKEELESDLDIYTKSDEYIKVFEIFEEKYEDVLEDLKEDSTDEELYSLIHMMIDEIIIFSRPKRKTDSVSGPKKEGQMIPYKLKISLKIPSEMLKDLLFSLAPEEKLQAKKHGWWAM